VLAISSVIRSGVLYRIVGGCAAVTKNNSNCAAVSLFLLLQSINKLHNCTWQGMLRALSIDVAGARNRARRGKKVPHNSQQGD
jgi:hypothetical protein